MNRVSIISVLLFSIILISISCVSGVSQEEHQRVKDELNAVQGELAALQIKLTEAVATLSLYEELNDRNATLESEFDAIQTRYEELGAKYDELYIKYDTIQSEYEAKKSQYEALQSKYEELSTEYEELSKRYEAVTDGVEAIVEEDIEQALFELINEARVENGKNILPWREALHERARENSIYLAMNKGLIYPEYDREWREVYWAEGYNSVDEIAEVTFLTWKNRFEYEKNFLWTYLDYGAVGVYKSGDIYYITYLGDHIQ